MLLFAVIINCNVVNADVTYEVQFTLTYTCRIRNGPDMHSIFYHKFA
ncbi:hypothetical protein LSAJ112_260008 [Latilactobacillus sakei]|nr:hypothetical protein LSAJ112_260008 [Latilactobacillus sakei]